MGAIPPLSHGDWLVAFEKYRLTSQYRLQNSGISLSDFQFIFWWEWAHRFLGRTVGVVFFIPFIIFALRGMLPNWLWPRLAGLFILGGLQGALGWYMVISGLVERVSVSQYRLAAHLSVAALIFTLCLWIYFNLNQRRFWPDMKLHKLALCITALVLLQITAGGFVAGLDAGQGYNTWPLMDGALIPSGLGAASPCWANLFENALTVQFNHRLLAYVIFVLVLAQAIIRRNTNASVILALVIVQVVLGIATLLMHVPLPLALMHQAGAMMVLTASVWNLSNQTTLR